MMATIQMLKADSPVYIEPYQFDLDGIGRHMRPVEGLESITIPTALVPTFLAWAGCYWRSEFERDLQSVAKSKDGKRLLTSSLPLVTFREELCCSALPRETHAIKAMLDNLREHMRPWRDAGVDTVAISGYNIR